MRGLRAPSALLVAALLLLPGIAPSPSASAGDTVVATALMAQGKKAFSARKYEDAVALFQKAWTEDPVLIEAVCWKAQALEKARDSASALVAYRDYIALAEKKRASKVASPEEERLRALAQKRVDALSVSEKEFRALEDRYVADLLAAMRSFLAKGAPGAALEAARRVLEVAPANAEALAAKKSLSDAPADTGPFAEVFTWTDVLGDKLFPASETVIYGDGSVSLDVKNGGRLRPRPGVNFSSDFGYDAEFKVSIPYIQDWEVGLAFADTSEGYFVLDLKKSKVSLLFGKPREAPVLVAAVALPELDVAAWHSLGVVTHGNVFQGWVDGKKQIEATVTQRPDAAGEILVQQSGCRVDWRRFRAGRIK